MKKIYCLLAAAILAVGCTEDITTDNAIVNNDANYEYVDVVADLEINEDSRTTLTNNGQGGKVVWSENDAIGAVLEDGTIVERVVKSIDGGKATFSVPTTTLYAIYPYSSKTTYTDGVLSHTLVSEVTLDGSAKVFGDGQNVMVAHLSEGKLPFKHLCGFIEIKLKGTGTVKHVALRSNSQNWDAMSGHGTIDLSDAANPTFTASTNQSEAFNWVYATCSNVELSKSEATSFYFIVPPRTYKDLCICVQTEEGSYTISSKNSIVVNRAMIRPIAAIDIDTVKPTAATDLSAGGVANCYIVPQGGDAKYYSFPARKINDNANLEGAYAHVVWSENAALVSNVSYDAATDTVSFKYAGNNAEGNALVAVLNANHEVLWSWHIWCTDQPGTFAVGDGNNKGVTLDRNLGATYAPTTENDAKNIDADKATETLGLYYQYGRHTPFPRAKNITTVAAETPCFSTNSNVTVMYGFQPEGQSLMNMNDKTKDHAAMMKAPNIFNIVYFTSNNAATISDEVTGLYAFCNNPYATNGNSMSWPSPNAEVITTKGMTDPCPPGYCIDGYDGAPYNTWRNLTQTRVARKKNDGTDMGYSFGCYYKDPNLDKVVWFPASGYRNEQANCVWVGRAANLWSTKNHSVKVYGIRWSVTLTSGETAKWGLGAVNTIGWGFNIRCRAMDRTAVQN